MTENFKEKVKVFSRMSILTAFLIALLIAGRVVIIPLAMAFLFAIVLNYFLRKLENRKVPRILAIILVMLGFLIIIGGILTFSSFQLAQLLEDLPAIEKKVIALVGNFRNQLETHWGISAPQQNRWANSLGDNAASFFTGFLQTTSSVLAAVALIPIYTFLMLLYKDKFRHFLNRMYSQERSDYASARIQEVKGVVQGYVSGMFIVICILAILNSVGLLLLGIQYALFFGIFSAMLTVIPYLGNFIGGLFPFLMALVTKDSAWYAFGVIAIYAFIQFIEGNFITPNIMGSRVRINPLIALISLIVGGQLLGIAGMILAIPFVGILKIALANSKTLSPFVILLDEHNENNSLNTNS